MAKKRALRLLLWVLAFPLVLLSVILEVFAPRNLSSDIDRCVAKASKRYSHIPCTFLDALIFAEDHRNSLHPGIDLIAMTRALWIRITQGGIQGASTIEQQFVRVMTNRYEKTARRKLREQIVALIIVRRLSKQEIAYGYLSSAFYGSGFVGIRGLEKWFGNDLSDVPFEQALRIVAQLKYPRPLSPDAEWQIKVERRFQILLGRVKNQAKKPVKGDAATSAH